MTDLPTEIPLDVLTAYSMQIASASPENKAIVEDLVMKMDMTLGTANTPQWAVVTALAMLTEVVRRASSDTLLAMIREQDMGGHNGTN